MTNIIVTGASGYAQHLTLAGYTQIFMLL